MNTKPVNVDLEYTANLVSQIVANQEEAKQKEIQKQKEEIDSLYKSLLGILKNCCKANTSQSNDEARNRRWNYEIQTGIKNGKLENWEFRSPMVDTDPVQWFGSLIIKFIDCACFKSDLLGDLKSLYDRSEFLEESKDVRNIIKTELLENKYPDYKKVKESLTKIYKLQLVGKKDQ